jgi:hypothetical protein
MTLNITKIKYDKPPKGADSKVAGLANLTLNDTLMISNIKICMGTHKDAVPYIEYPPAVKIIDSDSYKDLEKVILTGFCKSHLESGIMSESCSEFGKLLRKLWLELLAKNNPLTIKIPLRVPN